MKLSKASISAFCDEFQKIAREHSGANKALGIIEAGFRDGPQGLMVHSAIPVAAGAFAGGVSGGLIAKLGKKSKAMRLGLTLMPLGAAAGLYGGYSNLMKSKGIKMNAIVNSEFSPTAERKYILN